MFCFYFIDKFNNFFESQIYFALGIIIALLAYLIDKKRVYISIYVFLLILSLKFQSILFFSPLIFLQAEKFDDISLLTFLPILIINFFIYSDMFLETCLMNMLAIYFFYSNRERNILYNNYKEYFKKNSKAAQELNRINLSLISLSNDKIESAILSERNRIARDIHDGIGHKITRSIIQLGALQILEKDKEKKAQLGLINSNLKETMDDIRKSVHSIVDEDLDLENELKKIVNGYIDLEIVFSYKSTYSFSLNEKYSIIYIIKEALNNVRKHSNSNFVTLSIREVELFNFILIKDSGKNIKIKDEGIGLYSIASRVEKMGGSFEYTIEDGFRIFIALKKGRK